MLPWFPDRRHVGETKSTNPQIILTVVFCNSDVMSTLFTILCSMRYIRYFVQIRFQNQQLHQCLDSGAGTDSHVNVSD